MKHGHVFEAEARERTEGIKPAFNVVVAYDNRCAAARAMNVFAGVVREFGDEFEFQCDLWRFDVLGLPVVRAAAVRAGDAADLLLISARDDNEMPRLTGLELVKRLRAAGQSLPVVLASGTFNPDEAHSSQWLRVAATLRKPFRPEELLETVKAVLRAASGVRRRGDLFFPMLAEAFARIQPVRRWGINE